MYDVQYIQVSYADRLRASLPQRYIKLRNTELKYQQHQMSALQFVYIVHLIHLNHEF